jgi:hypothetical protein
MFEMGLGVGREFRHRSLSRPADVQDGVMNCPKGTSALGPLIPQHQTFAGASRTAVSCQFRTHALQQIDSYSITSSANICIEIGTSIPSALAVFMLMISSNLVGCITGRSAGFSPLRIRPARMTCPVFSDHG